MVLLLLVMNDQPRSEYIKIQVLLRKQACNSILNNITNFAIDLIFTWYV